MTGFCVIAQMMLLNFVNNMGDTRQLLTNTHKYYKIEVYISQRIEMMEFSRLAECKPGESSAFL